MCETRYIIREMKKEKRALTLLLLTLCYQFCFLTQGGRGHECGRQAEGAECPEGMCCSIWGWCGNTPPYCNPGVCQSQCPWWSTSASDHDQDITTVRSVVSRSMFDEMLKHRNDAACPARGFYTYDAFITAAKSFPEFATTSDIHARKRELAAFFAQTSHQTSGGWASAADGPYAWGYCYLEEIKKSGDYCVGHAQWPCVPGKQYYGRGPILLSYNYNYGACGEALGLDLLSNHDLVVRDPVIAFKSALWLWMTPQSPNKPSCHDVMIGKWTPTLGDLEARRLPGYGVTTNIINGGVECGHGPDPRVQSRIGFYKRYCDMLGVGYGHNLDCHNQIPFEWGWGPKLVDSM